MKTAHYRDYDIDERGHQVAQGYKKAAVLDRII
jgi:hypothetical protein